MVAIPEPSNGLEALIDRFYKITSTEVPRPHLGASLLGHSCDRWLWLSFRWAVIEQFSGRILRLFDRGKREEEFVIRNLRAVGVDVREDEDGKQFRVDFGGHVGGSLDGIIESGVPEAPQKRHVLEIKTHSLKSFNELRDKGVKDAKPMHYAQMQVYMRGSEIDRALYAAVCKDDDRLYFERVRYDADEANALITRGDRLTMADRIPEPLSADPTWYQCKFCAAHDLCHNSHMTREINCRTCAHSTATPGGTWECARYANATIPYDAQLAGCDAHVLHPDLVPWKLIGPYQGNSWAAVYEINGAHVPNGEANSESDDHVFTSRELVIDNRERIESGEDIVLIPF